MQTPTDPPNMPGLTAGPCMALSKAQGGICPSTILAMQQEQIEPLFQERRWALRVDTLCARCHGRDAQTAASLHDTNH
eukprot:4522648-Amphidinium_carterae.1